MGLIYSKHITITWPNCRTFLPSPSPSLNPIHAVIHFLASLVAGWQPPAYSVSMYISILNSPYKWNSKYHHCGSMDLSAACVYVCMCVCARTCVCMFVSVWQPENSLRCGSSSAVLLGFWDRISHWLGTYPAGEAGQPRASLHHGQGSQAHVPSGFFKMWVLVIELRSLCLPITN